ncbi:SLAP domain-containing protein [Schleiferilactobacillus harbinensis]|uniref:SLAP domain-containing protein n=1 Tax=Schleiferilactobacillus harbinensis TaxID=304207 RepID=UPI0039EA7996
MKKYAFTLLKKKVFALLAAAMLAGGALVATSAIASVAVHAEQPVETNGYYQEYPLNKIVTIAKASGSQVYSDPALTKPITGKVLPKGSRWQTTREVFSVATPHYFAYRLGGKQYIDSTDVVTPTNRGVFTVNVPNHPSWGTAVYNDQLKPLRILKAKSKWQVYDTTNFSGITYYDLGGHQYVKAGNGTFVPHY